MASIARTLGLNELKNSMNDLLAAGAGAAGMTLGGDFLLNKVLPESVKSKINGTYLEPVAHAVLGAASYVAIKKFVKNDAAALGAAAAGFGMAILTGYQMVSGAKPAEPITTPKATAGIAGLGIFADSYAGNRDLLLAGAPTSYMDMGMSHGMTQIENVGGLRGAPISYEDRGGTASFIS